MFIPASPLLRAPGRPIGDLSRFSSLAQRKHASKACYAPEPDGRARRKPPALRPRAVHRPGSGLPVTHDLLDTGNQGVIASGIGVVVPR